MVHETTSVAAHLLDFAIDQVALGKAAEEIHRCLQDLSTEASIPVHKIETRAKGLKSYQEKSERLKPDGSLKYPNPGGAIDDCVAARVIVFTTRAREDFVALLQQRFEVKEHINPGKIKNNGYDSDHLIVTGFIGEQTGVRYPELVKFFAKRPGLEIQIRTVAGHAWAEYEHDVRYKSAAYRNLDPHAKSQVDQWFVEAGGLRRYLDQVFNEIDTLLLPTVETSSITENEREQDIAKSAVDEFPDPIIDNSGPALDSESLRRYIADRYHGDLTPDTTDAIQELLEHLRELGITTVSGLESVLAGQDSSQIAERMEYSGPVSGARRLDDELLATFTSRYVETALDETRAHLLKLRLRRVNSVKETLTQNLS